MDFTAGVSFIFGQIGKLLFSLGSHFSLTSLAVALLVATLFFTWQCLLLCCCDPPSQVSCLP